MDLRDLWKVIQKKDVSALEDVLNKIGEDESHSLLTAVHKKSGDNCTHLMARHGKLAMLKLAHQKFGLSLEQVNLSKKAPMHETASNGHADIVQYLLSQGAAVDPLKHADWSPLMMACSKRNNLKVIKLLVNAGANSGLVNKDGWNCFHIASREGDTETLQYLHKNNPLLCKEVSKNMRSPLHTAAIHGCTDAVSFLLKECQLSYEIIDSCGSLPIMDACRSGSVKTIKILADLCPGAVYKTDKVGRNCLHISAEANKPTSVNYLITELSMPVNLPITLKSISQGQTALHLAYKEGNKETVALLLSLGALSGVKDANGDMPADMILVRRPVYGVQS
uniref:Ankyrin repeat domain-containing protein 16-like n=1 Tax=Phallusia mammillata TaxID=59560 RepID=A0A6F9D759_9ASCI|nr:ankyrin repeat domain-containing protein 16-like [Phallusia mammillata]